MAKETRDFLTVITYENSLGALTFISCIQLKVNRQCELLSQVIPVEMESNSCLQKKFVFQTCISSKWRLSVIYLQLSLEETFKLKS
jgi:hypothetical protein